MPTKVVVAEDEAIIRMDLRELLQEEGVRVVDGVADKDQRLDSEALTALLEDSD